LIRTLFKFLLTAAIAIPLMVVFPIAAVALSRSPEGAQVLFWAGPWSAAFYTLIYSVLSSVPWRQGGEAVRQHREAHGGLLVASMWATGWMFFGLFGSYFAEAALMFTTRRFAILPLATYSPLFACWLWRRRCVG
jgi:hypothetical protein